MDTSLRRWQVCGHAVPQWRGDQCTAQDGAQVLGHDFLLLHTAVVLQGEDHWVVGRLETTRQKTKNSGKKKKKSLCTECCWIIYDTGYQTHLKGILLDGFDHIFEEDLRSECVAVVDHWLICSVPAIQLHTATALHQSPE